MYSKMVSHTIPVLFAAIVMASCGGGDSAGDDSTLDRNLDLANQSSGNVALDDRATGGTSGGASKSTGGSGATSRTGTIATGSTISLASNSKVCTHTHKAADSFTASVKESITGTNGAVIPAGAVATVTITSLKRAEKSSDRAEMGFLITSIRIDGKDYPVDSRVTAVQAVQERSSTSKDAQKVIGGAVVGAVIGQILGKDTKSTVIGAATGAAAGTVVAMATGDYEGCVPSGGNITIALNAPLIMTVAN